MTDKILSGGNKICVDAGFCHLDDYGMLRDCSYQYYNLCKGVLSHAFDTVLAKRKVTRTIL